VTLAIDGRWLARAGLDAARDVRGGIGISGPYDFLPTSDRTLSKIFGPQQAWPDTQPINHVHADEPPLLLATGLRDGIVGPSNTRRLAARIRGAGGRVTERYYPEIGHIPIIGAFAPPLHWIAPVLDDTVRFIGGAAA
jgi:dipeptidyl aminopeptidase/acylaminoacyl peptidase